MGLSIAVYHRDKVNFYNFGTTEKGKYQPATAATVYEIGSITKTFVSTILAFAVTEGKVKLDDYIRKYLPGDYSNLAYEGEAVKLVHLANLTSELPNWLPDKPEAFQGISPDSIPSVLLNLHKNYTEQDSGNRRIWHTGGTFGFSSYVVFYPESKLGIVLLANESDGMTQNKLVNIARQISNGLGSVAK